MKERYEVGKAPDIIIENCHGELIVKGSHENGVLVKGDDATVTESDDGLTVNSNGRLRLYVPELATIRVDNAYSDVIVKNVQGAVSANLVSGDMILVGVAGAKLGDVHSDLSAKNVEGSVSANDVSGDAIFRQVGDITVNDVSGDLSARSVAGAVTANVVSGDLSLRNVSGDVTIATIHRDANLRLLEGQTSVGKVGGDVRIYGELAAGKHSFIAEGDIVLRWPADTDLTLTANAPKILNRINLENVVEADGSLSGQIGSDGPVVTLTANGRIVLKDLHVVREEWDHYQADDVEFDLTLDLENLTTQLMATVNDQISRVKTEIEGKFGPDFTARMEEKIARKAEQAARRAERAAEQARRRAERRVQQQRTRRPKPPTPPQRKKASPEEQLKILKMVEEGIITPEDANMLLQALED